MALTLRLNKGIPLTYQELDDNFTYLSASAGTLTAGPGITINNGYISASILTVNGSLPDASGNVLTSLTSVTTGLSSSLIASSSGAITASIPDGLVWVVAGETLPANTGSNGLAYIYDSASVGQWYPLSTFNVNSADGRYLQLSGGTLTGNLTMSGTSTVIGTSSWAGNLVSASFRTTGSTIYSTNPAAGTPAGAAVVDNIFVGGAAGNASTANSSIFIGSGSGDQAVAANASVFIGIATGYQAGKAVYSNFIGSTAGQLAYTASYSNFIGYSAGYNAQKANNSNFIGEYAGYSAVSASHSNFLGLYAGANAGSASYSTILGYQAGYNTASVNLGIKSNNIIIGTNITLPNGTKDSINLGGIIFATGSYSTVTGNPYSGSANGRVGINVTNPTYTLDLSGSLRATNGLSFSGSMNFQGPSGSDSAGTGSLNLLPVSTGWSTTDWFGDNSAGFYHTVGTTTALTNGSVAPIAGTYYYIRVNISDVTLTSDFLGISFGGVNLGSVAGNQTASLSCRAVSTGTLSVTPNATWDGTASFYIAPVTSSVAAISYNPTTSTLGTELRTLGFSNVAIGYAAGQKTIPIPSAPTTGKNNVFIGYNAAPNNTVGYSNVIIGANAGVSQISGNGNVTIGIGAGLSNDYGSSNITIGNNAGYYSSGSTVFGNVTIGFNAGQYNQGAYSVFVGAYAGRNTSTGLYNVAVGTQAIQNNTTGNNNTAVGTFAGINQSSGSANVYLGTNAGYSNISGSNNIFIGVSSGYANGLYGAAVASNVLIGSNTGYFNQGNYNTFVGVLSGYRNHSGSFNTYVGYAAGYSLQTLVGTPYTASDGTFSSNTMVGYYAGYGLYSGSNNVVVGFQAGYSTPYTASGNSIYIGYQAKPGQLNSVNEIVIAYTGSGAGSNTTTIGNKSTTTTILYGRTKITGSTSVLNLQPSNPLPAGNIGDFAVSASGATYKPYFYDGSAWVSLV